MAHPDGAVPDSDLAETLLARVDDIEGQLRAIPTASDEKALRELRRTIEALSKRDPKFEERVTNRVDVVADRVETVAKTVSTTAAGLAARDGELSQLRRELEAASGRTEAAVADLRRSVDPAALPELKRALAALSEQKLPRGIEGRVEDLTAKLGMLSQRVDSVSSTASTTATGLAGRDGDMIALRRAYESEAARIAADLADVRKSIDPAPVAELRQAVKELSDAAFGQKRSTQRHLDEVGAKIDTLGDRLDSFAASVTATATQVSGSESEISALRASVDNGASRLSSLVTELNKALAALAARAAALEDADAETARLLDAQGSGVGGKVDDLAARLDSLTTTVETTSDQLGQQNAQLVASEHRFQEASGKVDDLAARLDSLTTTVETTSDQLGQQNAQLVASEHRFQEASGKVDDLAARLDSLTTTVETTSDQLGQQNAQLVASEHRFQEASGKVDDLAARLDSLTTTVETTSDQLGQQNAQLVASEHRFQEASARVDGLVGELARALEEFPDPNFLEQSLQPRLDELAGHVADLSGQLAHVETTLSQQTQGTASESAELHRLLLAERGKVDDLTSRLDSLANSAAATATRIAGGEEEISALRASLEEDASRLRPVVGELKQTVDALSARATTLEEADGEAARRLDARVSDVSGSVDDLAARLDSLNASVATTTEHLRGRDVEISALRSEIAQRFDAVEREREVSTEAARAAEQSSKTVGTRVEELAARLDATDEQRDGATAEVTRLAAILEVERASFRARLDTLAAAQEKWTGSSAETSSNGGSQVVLTSSRASGRRWRPSSTAFPALSTSSEHLYRPSWRRSRQLSLSPRPPLSTRLWRHDSTSSPRSSTRSTSEASQSPRTSPGPGRFGRPRYARWRPGSTRSRPGRRTSPRRASKSSRSSPDRTTASRKQSLRRRRL